MRSRFANRVGVLFEALENRTMLSAAPMVAHHHGHHHNGHHSAALSATANPVLKMGQKAVASAGDPIYMNFTGINGEVQTVGFTNDIQLNSFQWGVGRGISSPTGGSANRESSAPSVSEITITKAMDKTSPKLLQQALAGEGTDVKIFFVNVSRGKPFVYAEYDLSGAMVSGYSVSSGGDRPSESLSLNFTKVVFTQSVQNPNGTTTSTSAGWDLAQGKAV